MAIEKPTTVQFHLEVLRQIPKSYPITADELHKKMANIGFNRSLRTIQRTLDSLCQQFDIDCDVSEKPYKYQWKPHTKGLDLPILNEAQSLVLTLAEQHLSSLLPTNIMTSMQPFFQQAKRNLDNTQKSGCEWLNKVAIAPTSQPLIPAKINNEIFENISTALFKNKCLNIIYKNQYNIEHSAQVEPLALVQQGASSYLVVRYSKKDIRHLALHRFIQATVSTFSFEPPQDFNLSRYIQEQRFGFGDGKKVIFRFSITDWAGFHLTETPLSDDQIILEQDDDHYRFQAIVFKSEMLAWWIAKFGNDIWDIEYQDLE
ncbi:WYL domain-containing protein [Pasteurella skyensis]|uniref:WYL domain-containing protein n=1 Tax=Phocoenobacter skyensis TaxID=97481 RepID=A0AAJ6NB44_9PAST|nr:WYL domain-containing protein [Pasteurella skyensis]MDP8161587.1 WYL domain-containing protein [Pasteurella skyensis]MDP8173421.1 WYL domain-containing protein [Pasteurella skyensis]MDP8175981.1 WYL domain-containing protein [Pasteurella skyensis]MDP8177949.1 WYL domain-containing protein [Pasteurella skyensis]MDP8182392.1 WYL domain-containing protein [Pasteurella skyensis]